MLDFIIWDLNPELFSIGSLAPRWYGPLFALGFFLGQYILDRIYKIEGKPQKDVEVITIYMVAATVIGARLGHCLFYEPDYFLAHPIEILYIWQGGLASHGAGIAIIIAIWIYSKRNKTQSFLYLMDRVAITVALAACFIRFGNLTNSEIIGIPTDAKQSFIFASSTSNYLKEAFKGQVADIKISETGKDSTLNGMFVTSININMNVKSFGSGDIKTMAEQNIVSVINAANQNEANIIITPENKVLVGEEGREGTPVVISAWGIPRHPAQLYESISSLILFIILILIYSRYKAKTPEGLLFGIFMIWIFTLRFFYEFIKESQVAFENDMTYKMGQLLSIPMVLLGIVVIVISLMNSKKKSIQ